MAIEGNAKGFEDFFPENLIPKIIQLVLDCWAKIATPLPSDREEKITRRLCAKIRNEKRHTEDLPFRADVESSEMTPDTGEEIGRVDLRFSHGYNEDVYFAFECKRLRYPDKQGGVIPNTGEYTGTNGMMRFISGKYAKGLRAGGMLGYVMDGNLQNAVNDIEKQIKKKAPVLKIKGGLSASSLFPSKKNARETQHNLTGRDFEIHHVFLTL